MHNRTAARPKVISDHPNYGVSPYALLRFNNVPFKYLGSVERAELARAFEGLGALEQWKVANVGAVLSALHELASGVLPDARKKVLLPLKRDVYNNRPSKVSMEQVEDLTDDPSVLRWRRVQQEVAELNAKIEGLYESTVEQERVGLQEMCRHPNFQKAVVLSSSSCHRNVVRYARTPVGSHGSRLRKAEPAILQYVTRAMTRTSPFGLYTSVAMAEWSEDGTGSYPIEIGRARASFVQPDHALVRRLLEKVVRHEEVRGVVAYKLCPDHAQKDDKILFDVYLDDPVNQPKVFETTRSRKSLRASPILRALVGRMAGRGGVYYGDLVSTVASWVGADRSDQARGFIDRLIDAGLLVPHVPVSEQSTALLTEARAFLSSLLPSPCGRIAEILTDIEERTNEFAALEADARQASLALIRQAWAEAFSLLGAEVPGEPQVYEDTAAPDQLRLSADSWVRIKDDIRRVLPLLEMFDGSHSLKAIVRDEFVEKYGVGGRCTSLFDFKEHIPKIYEKWSGTLPGWGFEDVEHDPYLAHLERLKDKLLDHLAESAALEAEEVVLPSWLVEEMTGELPEKLGSGWASYSVFMQAEVEGGKPQRAVVNKIYHGLGRFSSRFLPLLSDETADLIRDHIGSFFPDHHLPVEVRPVRGFNANLHPRLTEVEFDLDHHDTGGKIRFSDIVLEHDVDSDDVVALHAPTGRIVETLYLGFLVPYLLPHEMGLLCSLAGSMLVDFPFHEAAEKRLPDPTRAQVRSYPRVTFGDVVLCRRRWYFPRACIPQLEPGEPEATYFRRLNVWRSKEGVPTAVFFNMPTGGAPERETGDEEATLPYFLYDRPKPQYVHFHSPLLVRHLTKWLQKNRGDLFAEEVLPAFESSAVRSDDGAHAAELVVEFNRPARSWGE